MMSPNYQCVLRMRLNGTESARNLILDHIDIPALECNRLGSNWEMRPEKRRVDNQTARPQKQRDVRSKMIHQAQ